MSVTYMSHVLLLGLNDADVTFATVCSELASDKILACDMFGCGAQCSDHDTCDSQDSCLRTKAERLWCVENRDSGASTSNSIHTSGALQVDLGKHERLFLGSMSNLQLVLATFNILSAGVVDVGNDQRASDVGLNVGARLAAVEKLMSARGVHVAGLQETRVPQEGKSEIAGSEFVRVWSPSIKGRGGLLLLVSPMLNAEVVAISYVHHRVMAVLLEVGDRRLSVVVCHSPTAVKDQVEHEEFLQALEQAVDMFHAPVVMLGDFNLRVAAHVDGEVVGAEAETECLPHDWDRIARLLAWLRNRRLCLSNTFRADRGAGQGTWRHTSGQVA
eukprot:6490713-Amphidinium_carterae.2